MIAAHLLVALQPVMLCRASLCLQRKPSQCVAFDMTRPLPAMVSSKYYWLRISCNAGTATNRRTGCSWSQAWASHWSYLVWRRQATAWAFPFLYSFVAIFNYPNHTPRRKGTGEAGGLIIGVLCVCMTNEPHRNAFTKCDGILSCKPYFRVYHLPCGVIFGVICIPRLHSCYLLCAVAMCSIIHTRSASAAP